MQYLLEFQLRCLIYIRYIYLDLFMANIFLYLWLCIHELGKGPLKSVTIFYIVHTLVSLIHVV